MNRSLNILLFVLFGVGCQAPKMPLIDLSEPGWKERTGQALWQRSGAPRMSVDLHFAQGEDGVSWLQLSKGGLPMATVILTKNGWLLDGSMFGRKVSARGKPPARASPAQLAVALGEGTPGRDWACQTTAEGFVLANARSGERWEVCLDP